MKKLILWLRNYWYIVLVACLFVYYVEDAAVFKNVLPGRLYTSDYSLSSLLYVNVTQSNTKSADQKERILSPKLRLTAFVDSLYISGNTYTIHDEQFKQFFLKLATDEDYKKLYRHYYLDEISDAELQQIALYNSKKGYRQSFLKGYNAGLSGEYNNLSKKLDKVYKKNIIQIKLLSVSADPDSTVMISLKPSIFKYYDNAELMNNFMNYIVLFSLFLEFLMLLIILKHITLKRRYWYLELLLCIIWIFPSTLQYTSFTHGIKYVNILSMCSQLILLFIGFHTPNLLSKRMIWKSLYTLYTVFVVLSSIFHLWSSWVVTAPLILMLIILQFRKITGLKKRVMRKWFSISIVPTFVFVISLVSYSFIFHVIHSFPNRAVFDGFSTTNGSVNSLIGSINIISFVIVILFIFGSPLIAILSALTELSIRYYNAIRKWIAALLIFLGYMIALEWFVSVELERTFKNDFVTIYFVLSLGLLFTYLIMRVYRYFDAVRHNERKYLRSLLEGSFDISTIDEYFAYYQGVILELYPKTQIAFVSGETVINNNNLKLPSLDVFQAIPNTNYFNLDIAIIDGEPISEVFPVLDAPPRKSKKGSVIPQSHEVHLYFPLYNSEHQHLGYLLFGESGKLYWDKENADFLYETVQIFQSFLSSLLLQTQYRNEQLKLEREKQERIFEHQIATERELRAQELEEANRRMTDSISYAALIQQSILPNESILTNYLENYFLLWKPHDVVGGDFFWFCPIPNSKSFLLAMVDCTGHGVPGAFMTIMTNSILNSIVRDRHIYDPAEIIKMLHKEVQYTLQQGHKGSMNDGLDISLILLDPTQQKIGFAGAKHRILHWDAKMPDNSLAVYRGGRHSVGGIRPELDISLQEFNYHSGDMVYLFTDGLIDQPILQDKGIKRMTYDGWYEYFISLVRLDIREQNTTLVSKVDEMLVIHEQIDDITVLGIRL